jgi:hypothetical protein
VRFFLVVALAACAAARPSPAGPAGPRTTGPGWTCVSSAEARARCYRDASDCARAVTDRETMTCERAALAYCYAEQNSVDPESHPIQLCLASASDCQAAVDEVSNAGDILLVDSSCAAVP